MEDKGGEKGVGDKVVPVTDQFGSLFKHGWLRSTSSRLPVTEQAELLALPGKELKIWELKLLLQAAASGSYQNKSSGTCQAAHMRGEGVGDKEATDWSWS